MLFIHWIISAIAIIVAAYLIPGVHVTILSAFVLAVVLGIINIFIRPVLLIITLPLNVITLGLFTFVINALLIMLAALIVPGFTVDGFWWALLFAVVLSLVNAVFHAMSRAQ